MKKAKLSNGVKILYERVRGNITSFSIGFEAGANNDPAFKLGLAHCVEHMVFKGTRTRTEEEINRLCNEYLGFHNAMTNYPYVVYYGSCLKEDFENALDIYSDIVVNPTFNEEGFKEEISTILEELKEWKDDIGQHCEDLLFYNAFNYRRIKELIIGNDTTIKSITLEDVKNFYKAYYTGDNCVVSIATSLEFKDVIKIVEEKFRALEGNRESVRIIYENPKGGVYIEENLAINNCKLQYIFPIHDLSEREVTLLRLFNEYFVQGTSSILYDELRTKRGLIYDILGNIKNEKGIKLYSITLSTAKENLDSVRNIIEGKIQEIKGEKNQFTEEIFRKHVKSQNLKRMLELEKSIVLALRLCIYEIMYEKCDLVTEEFYNFNIGNSKEIDKLINKVFSNLTLGIIMPQNKENS